MEHPALALAYFWFVPQVKLKFTQHPIKALAEVAAQQLFRYCANMDADFQMPFMELQQAERNIIGACSGLPLALELMGAVLYCDVRDEPRPLNDWEEALAALQHGQNAADSDGKLKHVLDISFRALGPVAQEMFLDVATVLQDQHKEGPLAVWKALPNRVGASLLLESLERRSLLSFTFNGWLEMHDVLAALGRGMVLTEGNHYFGSRLWVQDGNVMGAGEALPVAQLHRVLDTLTCATALQMMNLRNSSQLITLPDSISRLVSLRFLDLSHCTSLTRLPEPFGQLSALKVLALNECENLEVLPNSIGQLKQLQVLWLNQCKQLGQLPESFTQLTGLCELELHWCNALTRLPELFGRLAALESLSLSGGLVALPESIGELTGLKFLALCDINAPPLTFSQLVGLEQLAFEECQFVDLPESFGNLVGLKELSFFNCQQLWTLPESVSQLQALRKLHLTFCEGLVRLPSLFGQLIQLQELDLCGCSKLEALPDSFGA
eukprot:GHUV01015586.1.p1 GENE.GHUV01015586.1~~GHUV01015586.1.p1  ORF type:complete len:495 (+),score=105.05 GHUV01015586.1:921-2405(+)